MRECVCVYLCLIYTVLHSPFGCVSDIVMKMMMMVMISAYQFAIMYSTSPVIVCTLIQCVLFEMLYYCQKKVTCLSPSVCL